MFALRASGASIDLKSPEGRDELLLAESSGRAVEVGIALLSRLGDEGFEAGALPVTDFETLLLNLRVARLGPAMSLGFTCARCRAVAEIAFMASDLIEATQPRRPASVSDDPARPGWFRVAEAGFRLPTARDQVEAAAHPHPERRLAELCLDDAARTPRLRGTPSGGVRGGNFGCRLFALEIVLGQASADERGRFRPLLSATRSNPGTTPCAAG